jgi:leucyl aminopeptidase
MDFAIASNLEHRKNADALVIPFWKGKKQAEPAAGLGKHSLPFQGPIEAQDFKAKEGEVLFLYPEKMTEKKKRLQQKSLDVLMQL